MPQIMLDLVAIQPFARAGCSLRREAVSATRRSKNMIDINALTFGRYSDGEIEPVSEFDSRASSVDAVRREEVIDVTPALRLSVTAFSIAASAILFAILLTTESLRPARWHLA